MSGHECSENSHVQVWYAASSLTVPEQHVGCAAPSAGL